MQWTGVNPRAVGVWRTDVNSRADIARFCPQDPMEIQQTGVNLKAISVQQTGVNLRTGIARFHRQIPIRTGKCIRDPHVTWEILTIIGGPYRAEESRYTCNRYAKEARNSPQALMHKAYKHPMTNTQRRSEDIVFTEADAKRVLHPHINTLLITVRVANSNVQRMLVDNDNVVDILYWDAYKKTGLI